MPKKRTQEEYESELAIKNPTVKVAGNYVNSNTPIPHYCTLHNMTWKVRPSDALNGSGCPECCRMRIRNKKKKPADQYVKELAEANQNIVVLEEYVNALTPILHQCKLDNYKWKVTPNSLLSGHGCPICAGNQKKTTEEYKLELAIINPDIEVLGEYDTANVHILHKCKKDGYEWMAKPSNVLQKKGCPMCANKIVSQKLSKTHEQYVEEVLINNQDVEVLEKYINEKTPILHKCKKDGYEWMATPSNILSGSMCPMCTGNIAWTTERYCQAVRDINPNIEVLGEYVGARTPILHKCKIDNHEWETIPDRVLRKAGCPICGNRRISQKLSKTHKKYVKEVSICNPDIEVLGQYAGANTQILHKCKKDGHEWMIAPSNVLLGCGCPQCKESKGERIVRQWLEHNKIIYKFQYKFSDCKDKCALPFDFYLPEYNMCIEYDGGQHFFPVNFSGKGAEYTEQQFKTTQYHDQIKNQYCADNGITLLRIPYFKNIEEELNKFFIHLV